MAKTALGILIAVVFGSRLVYAQTAARTFEPLVELSGQRLALAGQVALAKWDSHAAVEDAPREASVIASAVKLGQSKGLNREFVAGFFRSQIEANKTVQRSLLAGWHKIGHAPAHNPIDLNRVIRPRLDELQSQMIDELVATSASRASPSCPDELAKATAKYLAARNLASQSLEAEALSRALSSACTR